MDREAFLSRVAGYRRDGWRLAIINATAVLPAEGIEDGAFDVSWSFARDDAFEHLRERILPAEQVPSISGSFDAAFLYENEMRELFGIDVTGMELDLKGQLYKTAVRVPFAPSAIRRRLEATGRLEAIARPAAAGPHAVEAPTGARADGGPTGPRAAGPHVAAAPQGAGPHVAASPQAGGPHVAASPQPAPAARPVSGEDR